jgi:Rrf2 family transcriptional regulator, nitric oxide-sensitive transcriptional repressor
MLSQTAEYALRAVVYLAYNEGQPQTTEQIAQGTQVPVGYLSKVLQSLSRAGITTSQRGLGGGSRLARPSTDISVYDVIEVSDPVRRLDTCPLGITSHGANLCPLHRRLDDAAALMEKAFRETSIAEMLEEPTMSKPLCGLPDRPDTAGRLKINVGAPRPKS